MIWTPDRNRQQGRIVATMFSAAAGVPCGRCAVVAAGLRGSDKASALAREGIDPARYLAISVDRVLAELGTRSMIPVVAVQPDGGRRPRARRGAARSQAPSGSCVGEGRDVLLDITMAAEPSLRSWLQLLDIAGYQVEVVAAAITAEDAVRWADTEHRRAHDAYRVGSGLGGRYVDAAAIRAAAPAAAALAASDWSA